MMLPYEKIFTILAFSLVTNLVNTAMTQLVDRLERSANNPNDPRNREVVHPATDLQYGDLLTPINSSPIVKGIMRNLSFYRSGLSPVRRGVEVGLAHGYILVGPFAKFNPLRYTPAGTLGSLLAAFGLVVISTVLIVLYAASHPPAPLTATATPAPPAEFNQQKAWNEYARGFFIGGALGATIAYLILANFDVFNNFLNLTGAN
jgi:photosystem I subunit XI